MLLNDLLTLAQLGAEKPLFMWKEAFLQMTPELMKSLASVRDTLEDGTDVKRNVSTLTALLEEPEPNEYELAAALLSLFQIFSDEDAVHQQLIQSYYVAVKAFHRRAQSAEFHARARAGLVGKLSDKERADYDNRLFTQEGMMYVLEFYLTLYKAIKDASTQEEKRALIEHREVALEFGRVPGLWADVDADEILEKFAYKILDNSLRDEILRGYYAFKEILMKLNVTCNQDGSCVASYDRVSLEEVIGSFKTFLEVLLNVFQKAGIMELKSLFLKPYGDKPKLSTILL